MKDHLPRIILPQNVVRSGVIRMIGASSASIPWAYCGYLALNLRIAQACSLCADFGISFAFPRIKMYQSCVQSSSYSSIRSATRGTARMFRKRASRSGVTRFGFRSTAV